MTRARKAGGGGDSLRRVTEAVRGLSPSRYLLAVSGGRDSMVMLDAFVRCRSDAIVVATYDHGTGRAAEEAAGLVESEAKRRSMPVVTGHRPASAASGEAVWRAARWDFLSGLAAELSATVVTAHSRDDQLETVVMRVLRDPRHTSARGLAAMYARSPVARPLIDVGRADIAAYALANDVAYVDDPSNVSRAYLRNRVRLDLLPALERAQPGFADEFLSLARRAAQWRESVECLVDGLDVQLLPPLVVAAEPLIPLPTEALAVLWPAIAARAGIALDWRGTERLVAFTKSARVGGRIPLSGGGRVGRTPTTFVLHASAAE